jgi:two-component system sensor histidine kinase BarA
VRQRLRLAVVGPVLLVAAVVVLLIARDRLALLEQAAEQQARLVTTELTAIVATGHLTHPDELLQAALASIDGHPEIAVAELRNGLGLTVFRARTDSVHGLIAGLGHLAARLLALRDIRLAPQAETLAIAGADASAPLANALSRFSVQPSEDWVATRFTASMLPILAVVAALLIISWLMASALIASIVGPLARLTRHVARLEQGHLDSRLRDPGTDELGALATALNRMAGALFRGEQSLRDQIKLATGELQQTLQAVEVQNVELDVARRRALDASKVKSEFLANVSHEIRTPINGIVGFVDLLDHSPLDAEQRDYVSTIRESCSNLLTIVNDILDFSKIEAGKLVIDNVAFNLRDSVEEVLSLLAPSAYGRGLELTSLIYADVPRRLYGDPIRIRQVLTNLVHNAIKFTARGRVTVRVMLEDETDADTVIRVSVTDTGIGLGERDRAKLFQAFGQADASLTRRFGGTGLGLIISRKLLEQMNGEIGLESSPGKGSTFWFLLPLAKAPGSTPVERDGRNTPLAGRHAVVVDGEEISRLAIRHLLEGWSVQVTEAATVAEALSAPPWDIAVLGLSRADLADPGCGDWLMRLDARRSPVLVLASTVDRHELRALYQRGASACLPKAVRRQTVYRELCRLLLPSAGTVEHRRGDPLLPDEPPAFDAQEYSVLVVDDNAINRKLVVTIAARAGARVTEAADGLSAVRACESERFDVVFMDIHMPGMSGEQAARAIRHRLGSRSPRIIALTANALAGERERLLNSGMDGCLIKPITEAQVLELLIGDAGEVGGDGAPPPATDGGALRDELQRMLLAELPDHRRRIGEAWRAGELPQLADAVHKLHGGVSVCGLADLRARCRTLEDAARAGDRALLPGAVDDLLDALAALESEARRHPALP